MLGDPLLVAAASKLAYEESERKSKAIRSGKRRRVAERRESNGPPPFDYRVEDPDAAKKVRVPDPVEAPIVARLFEMLAEGQNLGEMTRWLNAQGVRTKRSNVFAPGRVRELLRNPWYAGKVRSGDELFDGKHDALVSWELFERVGAKLDEAAESVAERGGRRPIEATLLGGVMRCAHCGRGVWQRKYASGRRIYIGALERELAGYAKERDGLVKDEELVRIDYRRQLRDGSEGAARLAATEVERIEVERAALDAKLADMEARMAEWEGGHSADAVLDWWSEFSAGIRGDVVNSDSVRDANTALKERFAAIFVRSEKGRSPRLDFILKERPPGSPLVSSRLWVDDPDRLPDDVMLIDFIDEDFGEPLVKPDGSHWSTAAWPSRFASSGGCSWYHFATGCIVR